MTVPTRFLPKSALTAAVVLLIGCTFAAGALAQDSEVGDDLEDKPRTSSGARTAAGAAERARERRAAAKADSENTTASKAPQYPLATRTEPPQKYSGKEGKQASEIQADYDARKFAEVMAKADSFGAASTNPYMLSYIYQLAANAATDLDDLDKAIAYYKKAVDANGLDNNGHYHVMLNLAITLQKAERYAEALTYVERYLAETKTDKIEPLTLKAYLLSELDRAAEGAAVYEQILARKPEDRSVLMNAVAMYQMAENYEKANAMLEAARAKGMLNTANEYRTLFVGYVNAEKYKEAEAVLLEGVNKGAIPPSQTLADDYAILAHNYYMEEKIPQAIDYFTRANGLSKNGEAALNLALVLRQQDRLSEAKAAAREALAKGVKRPAEAQRILDLPGK